MGICASRRFKYMALVFALLLFITGTAFAQNFRLGDENEEIATIQSALKQLKFYTGDITGHFGTRTKEAIIKFQKKHKLMADGIVGEDTLRELYTAAGIPLESSAVFSGGSTSSSSSVSTLRFPERSGPAAPAESLHAGIL